MQRHLTQKKEAATLGNPSLITRNTQRHSLSRINCAFT